LNLIHNRQKHTDKTTIALQGAQMDCEAIKFEIGEDHVATITLDRPESHNAWNDQMASEMAWAWETVRDDDSVHSVLLVASGDRAFSTGADISGGTTWFFSSNVWNTFDPGQTLSPKTHHRCWKPVVAAVQGMCAGGGQYFLNEADIIIAAEDATFFDPHANGGIVSALEPIGMLYRGVPLGDVLRWALMGTEERITAETALRLGLVTEVVSGEDLHDRAHGIAADIAARNPRAIQGTVRAIWESLDLTRSIALQNGMAYTHIGNVRDPNAPRPERVNKDPEFR
jgi:enoyl-CoA hydratase/carnithine racemase